MSTSFSTNKANWQGVDEQPTSGSDNLVKSGGVFSAISAETSRATAAEQENVNEIRRRSVVDYHFSLKKLVLTNTTITFERFSFIWIRDYNSDNYLRYILAPGTYDLPTVINHSLYVSLENRDSNGNLIPAISGVGIDNTPNNWYMIGYNDAGSGRFLLSDAASVYQVNANNIAKNAQAITDEVARAQEAELANATAIENETTRATAAEEANAQSIDHIINNIGTVIPISDEILKANKYSFLLDDGTLSASLADYICVSDFINIENVLIKNIKAAFNRKEQEKRFVAFAFYSDRTEESFISSSRIYNDVIMYDWVLFDGSVAIPEGAKYIRIAGNYGFTTKTPTIEMVSIELNENIYANAPDSGYEYFTYDVDTSKGDIDDVKDSTNIIYPAEISKDNGFIRLPNTYTRSGKPTRLVIISHGAGGVVTDNYAESWNSTTILLLQKKGYAILFVNGVPESMRNTKYMAAENNGAAAHMGSWISLRSTLAAYKYVIEKYNIARDGCFLIGGSMGGLTSLNLAFSGVIPVKALAIDAPVLDLFHDAYFSGNWSGGTLGGKTPAIFAWIFQWDYCDFENDTYTIPIGKYNIFGMSYVIETEETKPLASLYTRSQDMAILWYLNENKMYGYNAYKTGDFLYKNLDSSHIYNLNTDNDEQYFAKKLPCPCKIWFGDGDTVNQINIAKRFVQKCRNGGSIITLRTCPTTEHTVTGSLTTKPDNVDISVVEDGITCSPFGVELINWLKRWDGNA